jgi:hypothetical protein
LRKIILTTLLFTLILSGCETDDLKDENKKLISMLDDANKQIQAYTQDKEILSKQVETLLNNKPQLEESTTDQQQFEIDLNQYKSLITDMMDIKDFEFEILSQAINREPYDKVVYIKNVSESNKDQEIYLLRAAMTFSTDDAKLISFWRDRKQAILYRDGQYDPEEGYTGWSGFDYRFGSINNSGQHPKLRQYNSRDDSQYLEFGKYTSDEN